MYSAILVPVDGSKLAERALTEALPIAELHGARLILLHAHERIASITLGGGAPVRDPALDLTWRDDQRVYLERLARRLQKQTKVPVQSIFRDGRIVPTIVDCIREENVGLVVIVTHGRGGFQRLWLGSVADGLIRSSPVPVLMIRGGRQTGKRMASTMIFSRVLVPLDGSERAERALGALSELIGSAPAKLTLAHVVHPMTAVAGLSSERSPEEFVVRTYLAPLEKRLANPNLDLKHEVRVHGNVARAIIEMADGAHATLIAIAGQGMSGLERFLVGSVADKVTRTASVPVLVVPGARMVAEV